ncbi:MAG: glycosyltransferase [Gemmatimonadales bacterium]|nr:glycosyltransferase [Gemmatimonadales bacterium]NIN13338.1 glycosyltransferase [Gemmatimonadales bacterium]NIN51341.1 glycosyltransferase [Gemmatimonadales bacterium]NIP08805.1 glycosyltransferase [Gemmatimonadales bacterium]NIQ99799.1 glycosyltransferase [Gemmatimonadales bacterium]
MRITLITATPQTARQGTGTYVAATTLRQGLESLGHRVRVVQPSGYDGWLPDTVQRFRFNLGLTPAMAESADMVVGFDMDGYRLAGRLRSPFITYVLGQLADEARFEKGLVAASMRLQARAERRAARRADLVVTLSEYSRRRIADVYGIASDRIAVVPPAFDYDRWHRALRHAEPMPAADRPPMVLCVARMYPRKNIAALVRAASALRERIPGLQVRIVGDGPRRRSLDRLARALNLHGCVYFAGQVSYDDLVRAYAMCDVFCLPSLQEGFGLVYLEAMAAGKPVVCCRDTAVAELVEDRVNGRVVPRRDDAALARALEGLLIDPAERRQMGETNQRKAASFGAPSGAERFLGAVSNVATGPEQT